MVPRETMKCQYCGASLILAEDGSSLLSRKRIACAKCGSTMADGSWFCTVCGEIITKDVNHLKQTQRKMRFQQESLKNDLSEICDKIEPDEFIYFSFRFKGLLSNKYFVVTDKKKIDMLSMTHEYSSFLKNAPVVIVATADEKLSSNHYVEDCTCAIMLLMLKAAELGLATCWGAVYNPGDQKREDYVRNILGVPKNHRVICNIGLGYPSYKPGKKTVKNFEQAAELC